MPCLSLLTLTSDKVAEGEGVYRVPHFLASRVLRDPHLGDRIRERGILQFALECSPGCVSWV